MATAFQNRLVGTIIIFALAVIFLPEILDGEKRRSQDRFESIPERPPMKDVVASEDFPFEEVQGAVTRQVEIVNEVPIDEAPSVNEAENSEELQTASTSGSTVSTSVNTQTTSTAESIMEPKQETVQAGWVVQLGSFRHQKNVRELLRKLEQAGYRAFTRPIQTSSGQLTKVFVGPDLDMGKLERAVPHLKEVTGLQGRISPFTVE